MVNNDTDSILWNLKMIIDLAYKAQNLYPDSKSLTVQIEERALEAHRQIRSLQDTTQFSTEDFARLKAKRE